MADDKEYDNLRGKLIKFEEFPSEIILKIFSFLEIVDLIKCSQMSTRIRIICYDKSLWQTINLSRKRVQTDFLQKVIDQDCKYLNLNEAKIIGTLRLQNQSQLTYLDLSGCTAESQSVFEELLESCHSLQTLSFTQDINVEVMFQMTAQNGKTLQILNCFGGTRSRFQMFSIECIIENCSELKELHFWNGVNIFESDGNICYLCGINDDAFDYLVNNISPEIEKLSFGYGGFDDHHIKTLVSRCTKLKELRLLAYTNIRNDLIAHIIDHLKLTLEKLLIDDAGNDENDYRKLYELKSMPKLKNLDFMYNTDDVNVISELRNKLPDVSVNGYPPLTSEEEKS